MPSRWLMTRGVRWSLALSRVPVSSRKCHASAPECARIRGAGGNGVIAEVEPEPRLRQAPPTAAPGKAHFFLPGAWLWLEQGGARLQR